MRMGPSQIQVTLLFTDSQITYLIQQLLQPCGKVPLKTTILHDLIWTIFPVM